MVHCNVNSLGKAPKNQQAYLKGVLPSLSDDRIYVALTEADPSGLGDMGLLDSKNQDSQLGSQLNLELKIQVTKSWHLKINEKVCSHKKYLMEYNTTASQVS